MNLFLKFAVRNVNRNAKVTFLNGIGITISVLIIMLIFSLSRGIESYIVKNNIRFETGAISISLDKTLISHSNEKKGKQLIEVLKSIIGKTKGISGYSTRIYPPNSILYIKENTQTISLIGLSQDEKKLIPEVFKIVNGDINTTQKNSLILSDGIAKEYGLKVNDVCSIMLQSVDGTINLEDFTITALFRYTSLGNKFNVYIGYNEGLKLYNSNLPSKILISVSDLEQVQHITKELVSKLKNDQFIEENEIYQHLNISNYQDQMGLARSLSSFNRYGMMSIAFFLVLISFVGVWSMQTENMTSRMRETGTLLSFGFSYASVRKIYIYESLYISFLYTVIGIVIAAGMIYAIQLNNGLYVGESASFAFGSSIILPVLFWGDIIITFLISLTYPLIATLLTLSGKNKNIVSMLNHK